MYRIRPCSLGAIVCLLLFFRSGATVQIVTVGNSGNGFAPLSFTINPGDTVKWIWVSGYHNTSSSTIPSGAAPWTENIINSGTTYSYVPLFSGTYQYECTYHSGMYGQFTVTGCANPARPVISSANGPNACAGAAVKMHILQQAGASYQWVVDNTSIGFATADTFDATASGTYKVVVNRCGVDSISFPYVVSIDSLPSPSFTYSGSGLTYTFTNTTGSISAHDYNWFFSDGSPLQTTINAVHTFSAPGSYTVALSATNSITGCDSTTIPTTIQTNHSSIGAISNKTSIYPNPANDVLFVPADPEISFHLRDLSGRILDIPITSVKNGHKLDISSLQPGLYLLSLVSKTGIAIEKISVHH